MGIHCYFWKSGNSLRLFWVGVGGGGQRSQKTQNHINGGKSTNKRQVYFNSRRPLYPLWMCTVVKGAPMLILITCSKSTLFATRITGTLSWARTCKKKMAFRAEIHQATSSRVLNLNIANVINMCAGSLLHRKYIDIDVYGFSCNLNYLWDNWVP
jgi:hypothetical protein